MGRVKTIARRTFLIGSAAVAGGVAFGVWRYNTPYENPLTNDLGPGAAALTPYVLINADGITLITPRADKGQGAYHVQALAALRSGIKRVLIPHLNESLLQLLQATGRSLQNGSSR